MIIHQFPLALPIRDQPNLKPLVSVNGPQLSQSLFFALHSICSVVILKYEYS